MKFRALNATLVISIFALSIVAAAVPVQAHFTLGDLTGTFRYHANDFDAHVPGVIGYVWPGAGQNAYAGFPNFASVNSGPGYQSPYPGGNPGAVAGFSGNAPSSSWYQLQGDTYAPFGAILAGSTGDLIFAINATKCVSATGPDFCVTPNKGWGSIVILLPPGFTTLMDGSNVVSTITNDYSGVYVSKLSPFDRYAPGWTAFQIHADGAVIGGPNGGAVHQNHQFINFTSAGEWYYFRINGVTAPTIAGRYFFKVLLGGSSNKIAGEEGTASNFVATSPTAAAGASALFLGGRPFTQLPVQFIPTENWPVLLVKGEVDPGIITGTIRYAGFNQTLYNLPFGEAGRVYAKMSMRLDPYTGQSRPDLPKIDAVGYFNATAHGHYEVEGMAPGIYDLYASAAGYPQTIIATGVTVLKGQSLHFDGYLQPGPVIHGNVFTKHQFGDEPWPCGDTGVSYPLGTSNPISSCYSSGSGNINGEYVKVELYDGPTLSHIPSSKANMVSWSPLPCVAGGQEHYNPNSHAGLCQDPRLGGNIAFPWHEYVPSNGYFSGVSSAAFNFYQVSTGYSNPQSNVAFALSTQDPQGVGPPQHWFVQGGTTTPFHFEFGSKGEYGAPRDLDGMVPQVYATWINGLTPGRYYARAWVFRYVQSALDGSTFQEYYFDVTPNEWAGDITLPIDLRLSSWVNKTVHFHNALNTITEDPINTGAGFMSGYLAGLDKQIYSYNQTALGVTDRNLCKRILLPRYCYPIGPGLGHWPNAGQLAGGDGLPTTVIGGDICTPLTNGGVCPGVNSGVDLDKAKLNQNAIQQGRANLQFWGINDTWSGQNYGIPSGTYLPFTFVLGYVSDTSTEMVSVTLSGNPTSISNHMFRGVGFNLTIYSIDWERPTVNRPWEFGNPSGFDTNADQVGAEIDVAFFKNNTLADWAGDVNSPNRAWASTIPTTGLYQGETFNSFLSRNGAPIYSSFSTQMVGGGIDVIDSRGNWQTANNTFFGNEMKGLGFVGGLIAGFIPYIFPFQDAPSMRPEYQFVVPGFLEPTSFDTGQYDLRAYTYGYVQRVPAYSVYGLRTQIADMRINLLTGVNITLDILFKKENIITATSANMSSRIRLFNDQGVLVGEWMSSEGAYVNKTGFIRTADGTNAYPFGPMGVAGIGVCSLLPNNRCLLAPTSGAADYNFVPGGTNLLHAVIAGLPQVPASGAQAPFYVPLGNYVGDPVFTHTAIGECNFAIYCVPYGRYPFPNTGIAGAPDYQGGWTAEVDFVNWYNNNTITTLSGCEITGVACGGQYYPPVPGLLMGESYHLIPGSTAKSGISITEDSALAKPPTFLGHSMALNHLGPYSQRGVWQISNAHLSGEASAIFEVDLNGLVSGNALAFTWSNEFRPLSWGTITVTGAGLPSTGLNFYTYDGIYEAYLPSTIGASGSVIYTFSLNAPGYAPQTWKAAVSSGQKGTGQNLYLEQTNIPIPEFNIVAVVTAVSLITSMWILGRRKP